MKPTETKQWLPDHGTNYRGVILHAAVGKYEVLGVKCLDMIEVNKIIDEAHGVIKKSIVK